MPKRQRIHADDFRIAWLCALPLELTAAKYMLDEQYDDTDFAPQYTLGRIGRHNVVLICLPVGQIGTNSAAAAAAGVCHVSPAIRMILMIGIAGGIPGPKNDVRLGDVVIGTPQGRYPGVIQYDMVKSLSEGQQVQNGSLNAPPQQLLMAVSNLLSTQQAGKSSIPAHMSTAASAPEFGRPVSNSDILFPAASSHIGGDTCTECNKDIIVTRAVRTTDHPQIHCGIIASGNQLMRDARRRDEINALFDGSLLCFEMESAGLTNILPSLAVRGICDYADSHKNKMWQPYAALAAAACAKEILSFVPPSVVSVAPPIHGHFTDDISLENDGRPNAMVLRPQMVQARVDSQGLEHHELMKSLKFEQMDARHDSIKPAYARTCLWLLDKDEYREWAESSHTSTNNNFLWIKGNPGTGKSTIMKFTSTHVEQNLNYGALLISFFFNGRGEELERSTLGMFRSLLHQLLHSLPDLQNVFSALPAASTGSGPLCWSIDNLQDLFSLAILRLGERLVICFVDALDECEEIQVQEMVSFFERLNHLSIASQVRFRICFASRHYPHITIENAISLVLEDQEGHKQDIERYLSNELKIGHGKPATEIKGRVLEKSAGIFLWVALVVPMLNKEFRRERIYALEQKLIEIPEKLDDLFRDILQRDN